MERTEDIDISYYEIRKEQYLVEAEQLYGKRTEYNFDKVYFHEEGPETIISIAAMMNLTRAFEVKLHPVAKTNKTSGILQMSHEVIHILSPINFADEGNMNYLEEGLAVYFSKIITERDTSDLEITDRAMDLKSEYRTAYNLFLELIVDEPEAIRRLREICPIISFITTDTFKSAGLRTDDSLVKKLLTKFTRH